MTLGVCSSQGVPGSTISVAGARISDGVIDATDPTQLVTLGHAQLFDRPLRQIADINVSRCDLHIHRNIDADWPRPACQHCVEAPVQDRCGSIGGVNFKSGLGGRFCQTGKVGRMFAVQRLHHTMPAHVGRNRSG